MKSVKTTLILVVILISHTITGQTAGPGWEKWNFLIGEWIGEGSADRPLC